mgnify:CR=1 FL=1
MDGPRPPLEQELTEVVELVNTVFSPEDRTMGLEFPQLFSGGNLDRLRVFVDQTAGIPVAHGGYVAQELVVEGWRIPVAALGSVCTLPAYRGKGLASRLVESIMDQARSEGLVMMLISGDSNVYKRLGAVETGDFVRVEAHQDQLSYLCEIARAWGDDREIVCRQAGAEDVPSMAATYRREPVRYARSVKDFHELAWWRSDVKRLYAYESIQVACTGRETLAYIVTRVRTLDGGGVRLHVPEFAGPRWAVACLVGHACTAFSPNVLTMTVCSSDRDMVETLRRAALPLRRTTLPGYTVMALDSSALLSSAGSIISERGGAARDDSLSRLLALSGADLVKALFGGTDAIPLPVPGLNFI